MFTNEIRPYKSHADHRKQTCDTHFVTQVGILDVEARRFHGTECRFNLPAFFIGRYSIFRSVETDQDLKFGYPVRVFDSTSCKIDILPFMQKELVVEFLLSDFKRIEEPPRSDSFSCGGLDNPNILPDTDIVSNPVVVKPSNPLLTDKLAIAHKAVDAVMSKKSDEPLHDIPAFIPIGIAPFVQKTEQQWKGNAFVGDAESEYIDVELSELPVGAVHTQNQTVLNRKQREDHPCHQVEVQGIVGDESLNAAQIGITLNRRRHCRSQFMKAHSLYHTKCMEHISHKLNAGQIHRFSKILLHNREDLVNFDQVLGISSLHRESG